jgi:RimJ/RimL family protein N-acetyltransferase
MADEVVIRALASAAELGLFSGLSYVLDEELADDLAHGLRRPEWMWVALRDRRLVARAAWWGPAVDEPPSVLDFLDVGDDGDRVEVGARLLRAAIANVVPAGMVPPEYTRFVVPDWREVPATRTVVEDLMGIVSAVGGRLLAERFRFRWRPPTPIRPVSGRIVFRSLVDEHELIDLMTAALQDTLDAHSRQDLARMPARDAATRHFRDELAGYCTPREWWRVATLPSGEPVGFVIPAHNSYGPIIAYVGVLPAHRGNRYIDDLLAEGTRILAEHHPPRIHASTDLGNAAMAAAFVRAGWVNFERSITMTWEHGQERNGQVPRGGIPPSRSCAHPLRSPTSCSSGPAHSSMRRSWSSSPRT